MKTKYQNNMIKNLTVILLPDYSVYILKASPISTIIVTHVLKNNIQISMEEVSKLLYIFVWFVLLIYKMGGHIISNLIMLSRTENKKLHKNIFWTDHWLQGNCVRFGIKSKYNFISSGWVCESNVTYKVQLSLEIYFIFHQHCSYFIIFLLYIHLWKRTRTNMK